MTTLYRDTPIFKRAVVLSCTVHFVLFLLIIFQPRFPKPSRKEMTYYVNVVTFSGGTPPGSGGKGEEKIAETAIPERKTLKDLTTPSKLQQEPASSLRYPVKKPKKETKPKKEKESVIQKQPIETQKSKTDPAGGKGKGTGSGVRIGGGGSEGPGLDAGFKSEYSSQIGLSNFPYTYYLQILTTRVSNNWFTSLVDPGISGNFQVTVQFKIQKNGSISDFKIKESSGIRSLDLSALRAIQTSSPFPPLPSEYEDEYLVIYLIFEHSK